MRGTFQVATPGSWEEWSEQKRHLLAVHNDKKKVYFIGHSPSGLFRTNANNDKLIFK